MFIFRVVYAFLFTREFDLAGDEAYYWDWGRRLDWGYYSKPPMIGWLMGLVGRLSGNQEWAIRLAPLVLGTGSLFALHRLVRAMFDSRTAFLAVLLVAFTPGNAALNLLFTIDAPLVLTWTCALLFFWRAVEDPRSWKWWLLLALAIGLGSLSKQMMLVFPLLMIAFVAVSPKDRALLRSGKMWLAILLGAAFLTPVLIWQQANGWPTVNHMKDHFEVGEHPGVLQHIVWFFQFPVVQSLIYSPVTWVVAMVVLVGAVKSWRAGALDRRGVLLVLFSAPALVVFFLLATRQEVHPNWPAVFYIPVFALAAAWIEQAISIPSVSDKWRVWSRRGLRVGFAMALLAYVYPMLSRPLGLAGHPKLDPFERLRGWKEAGEKMGEFLNKTPHAADTMVVVFGHRHYASEAAFYMPQQPRVFRWQPDGKKMSQYEIWPSPGPEKQWYSVLLIYPDSDEEGYSKGNISLFFRHWFKRIEKMGDIDIPVGHGIRRSYQVFLCKRMEHWPESIPEQLERYPEMRQIVESKSEPAESVIIQPKQEEKK